MSTKWPFVNLRQTCSVIAGQSPSSSFYNEKGDGIPFYQGKKEFSERFLGPPTTWTTYAPKEARSGDILMSVRAPVGPINIATRNICIGRGLAAIRPSDRLNRDFLFYFLLSQQSSISGKAGAVFASINKKQIEKIALPLPPLPEQRRIVAILDGAFATINAAIANTEKNLTNARELFESYLNRVFDDILADGTTVELSDLTEEITDGDHSPPPKATDGVPFITISNINKDSRQIDFTDTFMVPRDYFARLKQKRIPKRGDVLYTVTGSFGIPVVIDFDLDFCFQRHIGLIRPKPNVNSMWLSYALLTRYVLHQAADKATGTAQKTVGLRALRSFKMPSMTLSAQKSTVEFLDSIAERTRRLESRYTRKLDALTEMKQSILKKAFSGELTADVADDVMEEAA